MNFRKYYFNTKMILGTTHHLQILYRSEALIKSQTFVYEIARENLSYSNEERR